MPSEPRVTRLSPRARLTCRILGVVLLVAGAASFATAVMTMTAGPSVTDPQFEQKSKAAFRSSVIFGFGGILLLGVGSSLAKLGFMGAVSGIVATETSPAVEVSSGAFGRGLGRGLAEAGVVGGRGGGTVQLVRVKCRSCGFLESEDATFCSKCGKAV